MAQDTLSQAQTKKLFGKPQGSTHRSIDGIEPGTQLNVGDLIRVVLLAEPSYLDALWDDAQENAEEHTQEVLDKFGKAGLVVVANKVQGADLGAIGLDDREAYCYDLEIVAIVQPEAPLQVQEGSVAGIYAVAVLLTSAFLVIGVTLAWKIQVEGGGPITDSIFWLSAAVIAAAVAVVYIKARKATNG